jgi:hypothetical protein
MSIRFKCPHCKKGLVVKDALAGKKAACPACKKALKIPVPVSQPADVEALAAAAFSDELPKAAAKKEPEKPAAPQFVEFICPMCDAALKLGADLAGKRSQCPECKNIIKVPNLEISKPKDWREANKGPSLAAANQPQKLEGAWGSTTDKGKVSQEALEEADAILYDDEPQFAGGWLRRGLRVGAVAAVLLLAWWGVNAWRSSNQQKSSLEQALDAVDPKKLAEIDMPPAWAAVVHRGAGEFYATKKEAANARKQFDKAIAPFINAKDKSVDKDLFLMRFAASLLDLGGTEQEAIGKERVKWEELLGELNGAVTKIHDEEARTIAVRDLGGKLLQRKQPAGFAFTVASTAQVKSQQICFKYLDAKDGKEQEKLPSPEKGIKDPAIRIGFAEGRARKKEPAWDIATAKGDPKNEKLHKLQACVGVASVLLEEPRTADAIQSAEPCVKEALTIVEGWQAKDKPSPWVLLQLVKVVAVSDVPKAKDLIKDLPKEFKPWAQLALLEQDLAKTPGEVPLSRVEEVEDEKSLARAWAWTEISFHNSKLGYQGSMRSAADEADKRVRPLILIGIARGVQQRNQ